MAYCTSSQVASEFKKITFSSTTVITDTEVDAFIAQADVEINSHLSCKYSTPITNATDLLLIQMISVWLTAHRVRKLMEVRMPDGGKSQRAEKDERAQALKILENLVSGKQKLVNSTLATSADGMKGFDYSSDHERTFDVSINQW